LATKLSVERSLLSLNVRLVHVLSESRRGRGLAAPNWDLAIDVNIAFDDCINDPAGYDVDSDLLCFDVDPCPIDAENDIDGDGLCESEDSCKFDNDNDVDSDGLCDTSPFLCSDNDNIDTGFGQCATYAAGEHNEGRCHEHGVCEQCGCSCFDECADSCPTDPDNDADSDELCADVDSCPQDVENDVDADGLCGDVDSCPYDWYNDFDSDSICGDVDVCPWRTNIDDRTAMTPNEVGDDLVCSTDGLDEILLFTFEFDVDCVSSLADVSWARPCDGTQPCTLALQLGATQAPQNEYEPFHDDVIALLAYSIEKAYTSVYGRNLDGTPRDTSVALQFYDINFDESASLDADNKDFTAYVFKVQVPYNATVDETLAVDRVEALASSANLDIGCLPTAGVPQVAFALAVTEPVEEVDYTWLYVLIAVVVVIIIVIIIVVIVMQKKHDNLHRKVHMMPVGQYPISTRPPQNKDSPRGVELMPSPVRVPREEPDSKTEEAKESKDSPREPAQQETTPRNAGDVPEFLHTFSRKTQDSAAKPEMDMKKISKAHQAARDWVQCVDAEGYPFYYSGTTGKGQWERPEALDDPNLALQDAVVSDALKFKRELAAARLKKLGTGNPPPEPRPAGVARVVAVSPIPLAGRKKSKLKDDLKKFKPTAATDIDDSAVAAGPQAARRRRRARARKAQVISKESGELGASTKIDHEPDAERAELLQVGPGSRRSRKSGGSSAQVVDSSSSGRRSTRRRRRRAAPAEATSSSAAPATEGKSSSGRRSRRRHTVSTTSGEVEKSESESEKGGGSPRWRRAQKAVAKSFTDRLQSLGDGQAKASTDGQAEEALDAWFYSDPVLQSAEQEKTL